MSRKTCAGPGDSYLNAVICSFMGNSTEQVVYRRQIQTVYCGNFGLWLQTASGIFMAACLLRVSSGLQTPCELCAVAVALLLIC